MKNGLEDKYIIKDNKKLRFGYTTGTCAAAAAQAAARMLFSGQAVSAVKLTVPKGLTLFLEPLEAVLDEDGAGCAIRKDAGDDPDVTDGLLVHAYVRKCGVREAAEQMKKYGWQPQEENKREHGSIICIQGGSGIGTVTLPGLEQPVGAPAINRVPRSMIVKEVQAVCEEYGYSGGMQVTISAPGGEKLAERTFNPRLGIKGGISILGTSGIVEPMSEQALVTSIETEMRQKSVNRKYLLVTPGNYGADYLKANFPFGPDQAVKCSNYVGQTIDLAVNLELKGLLFVAHIGKFVKVAGGIMNTHSRDADARMEILAACALQAGIDGDRAREILDSVTADEGLRVIREAGVWDLSVEILMKKIDCCMNRRAWNRLKIGAVVFSNVYGELGRTKDADELLARLEAGM